METTSSVLTWCVPLFFAVGLGLTLWESWLTRREEEPNKWKRFIKRAGLTLLCLDFVLVLASTIIAGQINAKRDRQMALIRGWSFDHDERRRFIDALDDIKPEPFIVEYPGSEKEPAELGGQLLGTFWCVRLTPDVRYGIGLDDLPIHTDHEGVGLFAKSRTGFLDAIERAFLRAGRKVFVDINASHPDDKIVVSIGHWPRDEGNPNAK